MDDRTEPEAPVFFRKYADGRVRPDGPPPVEPAHLADEALARKANNPWAGELRVTYRQAAPPGQARRSRPTDGPTPRSRRGLGPIAAVGAMLCAAVLAGLLRPWPGDRPAAPPSARPQPRAASPSLQIELPPSARVQPPPRGLTSDPAAPGAAPTSAPAKAPARDAAPPDRAYAATAETPVRVFVHITSADQLPAANRIRRQLGALRVAGQAVGAPPVRIVARSPRRTELRCLKHADCPAANRVARRLAQSLGTPVAVVDMSPTFEGDRRVRAGSLELWLRL